ncbi:hypothetical protein DHD80_13180 [Gramella sp. AN32]|nr:hypothetical protein [Gramella sp. AN32]
MIAKDIKISSLGELANYASKSGNVISMAPGTYHFKDYISEEAMKAKHDNKQFYFMKFNGNNNIFKLEGVEIIVDTKLREALDPPIHTNEFVLSGGNNTLEGLQIKYIGNGTSSGGAAFEVSGEGNVLRNLTLYVKGSSPYGYGDLFGKGRDYVIRHEKHSGLLVTGSNTKLYGCKLYMRSFGHGFFIQNNAENIYFEDCYVEGEVRETDEILAETSGPAYDVNFKTWTKNREEKYVVTPGYMKSLVEDGFRTYGNIKNIHFKNCTAKNTRAGFELRTNGGVRLENCTTIGTERAYWIGDDAVVKNCKGDANYGPLMFVEGSNVEVDLTVIPAESDRLVHALVTIQGSNNKILLKSENGKKREKNLPILVGYTHPEHGEAMSPYSEGETSNLNLRNETGMPIEIGAKVSHSTIETNGEIIENRSGSTEVKKIEN